MTRISRRLFLGGAALLGAGIALDRVAQVPTPVAEQGDVLDEESPKPTSAPDDATPTLGVVTSALVNTQGVVAVSAVGHSLALTRGGEVVAWGGNEYGQTDVPSGLRDVVSVAAGLQHSLAVTRGGEVVAWGDNEYGQTNVPSGLRDVIAVAAGLQHSLALTRGGEVVAWGRNNDGQTDMPSGLRDVTAIAAGGYHSLALTRAGEVIAWGVDGSGQTSVPSVLRDVVAVAAGLQHSLAVTSSGEVVAWGWNNEGQTDVPSGLRDVVAVSAGGGHSLALTRSGEVVAWGRNNDGQTNVPSELRDVVAVAAGLQHSLVVTSSGEVVAWGRNDGGQTNVPVALQSAYAQSTPRQSNDATPTIAPTVGRKVVVDLTFWWWDESGQIWANEYNKRNRGARVTFVYTPFADAHDKLLASFVSGSGAPDIASIEIGRMGGFMAKGGLFDLKAAPFDGGIYEKDMVRHKWTQGSTADGRLIAMPWDIGPAGFWYRADLMQQLGLPTDPQAVEELISHTKGKSWFDFFELSQQVNETSGGTTKMIADAATDIYGGALRQGGEGYFDGQKVLIEEKATRPAQLAAEFRSLRLDANMSWWGRSWDDGVANNSFLGMLIACWMQGNLVRSHPQTISHWRVVPAPEASYNWGGSFCAIPEQTKNAEMAWDFVQWACCSAEGQNAMFIPTGVFPAYKPAWADPLYDAPVDFFGGQRAYRVWTNIAENVSSIVRSPYDLQADDIVNAEMSMVMNARKDPAQAMRDAENEVLRVIAGTIP